MKQTIDSVQLASEVQSRVAHFANLEGISVERWILTAIESKLELAEFLYCRSNAKSRGDFTDFLRSAPEVPPQSGDELPEGWAQPG